MGRPAVRHHLDPGRPHLPAQPRPRSHRRSSRDGRGPAFLTDTDMNAPSSMFRASLVLPAMRDAFRKLNPRELIRNPVMFVTACVAALLTLLLVLGEPGLPLGFQLQPIFWLWLTVLFGPFADASADGRGRAPAASLRPTT